MELRHLRYFTAVASELSFRKASEKLHLAGPTLSKQIRDLEETLGTALFHRSTRQVRLTVAGEVFLEQAQIILAQVERAQEMTRAAAEGKLGTLRIGNAGPLLLAFMPGCLNDFRKEHPEIEVNLVEADFDDQLAGVLDGSLHIGFVVDGTQQLSSDISHFPVQTMRLHVAHGCDHRLAKLKQVRLRDLEDEKLLSYHSGGSTHSAHARFMADILASAGVNMGPTRTVNGYDSFIAMIAGGTRVSLVARHPGMRGLEGLSVRRLKESPERCSFRVSAIWREEFLPAMAQAFLEVLRQHSGNS